MADLNGAFAAAFDESTNSIRVTNAGTTAGAVTEETPDANAAGRALEGDELRVVFV